MLSRLKKGASHLHIPHDRGSNQFVRANVFHVELRKFGECTRYNISEFEQ